MSDALLLRAAELAALGDREEAAALLARRDRVEAERMGAMARSSGLWALLADFQGAGLEGARIQAVRRDLAVERVLGLASEALVSTGCPHVFIKGAVLRGTIYPRTYHRPMTDVDVLVPPRAAGRCEQVLVDAGFRHVPPGRAVTDRFDREVKLAAPAGLPRIELHTGLVNDRGALGGDPGSVLKRSTTESGLRRPSWEDHLVIVAVHMAWHGFSVPLVNVLDLHLVAMRVSDWDMVAGTSRSWGCSGAVHTALELSRVAFGTEIPGRTMEAMEPKGLRGAILRAFPPFMRRTSPGSIGLGRTRLDLTVAGTVGRGLALALYVDGCVSRAAYLAWLSATRSLDAAAALLLYG